MQRYSIRSVRTSTSSPSPETFKAAPARDAPHARGDRVLQGVRCVSGTHLTLVKQACGQPSALTFFSSKITWDWHGARGRGDNWGMD